MRGPRRSISLAPRATWALVLAAALTVFAGSLLALAAGRQARASEPCNLTAHDSDRPDVASGPMWHVVYARPADRGDRAGLVAKRAEEQARAAAGQLNRQDPAATLALDETSVCGRRRLDVTAVAMRGRAAEYTTAAAISRDLFAGALRRAAEKRYIVYWDGDRLPGLDASTQGASYVPSQPFVLLFGIPASSRVVLHEVVHGLGTRGAAVSSSAPHHCENGHVCDDADDLMKPGGGSELDRGHDDYWGRPGTGLQHCAACSAQPEDVRLSPFLRRFDGAANRTPPSEVAHVESVVSTADLGSAYLHWQPADDDRAVVEYVVRGWQLSAGWGESSFSTAEFEAARSDEPGVLVEGLSSGADYLFAVQAVDSGGNRGVSGLASVALRAKPATPAGLAVDLGMAGGGYCASQFRAGAVLTWWSSNRPEDRRVFVYRVTVEKAALGDFPTSEVPVGTRYELSVPLVTRASLPRLEGGATYVVSVRADDRGGNVSDGGLLTVQVPSLRPGYVSPPRLPTGAAARVLQRNALAGSSGAASYSLDASSALPPGLGVDAATGDISGAPLRPGRYRAKVRLDCAAPGPGVDAAQLTGEVSLVVEGARFSYPNPVRVQRAATVPDDDPVLASPTVFWAGGTPRFTVEEGALPRGTRLDPATGELVGGTAAAPGTYAATVAMTDDYGTESVALNVEVVAVGKPL